MSELIYKQDAKDAVDMALDTIDHVPEWVYDILLNSLDKVPSAEPPSRYVAKIEINKEDIEELVAEKVEEIKEAMSGKWIPCSERPPKKPGSYICTCSDGTPYPKVTVIKFHPRTKAWELNGTRAYWKVRAWMSFPTPYQPKEMNHDQA